MTKTRILGISLFVMILLNLAMIIFGFFKRPSHPPKDGPKQMIIERLSLDSEQQSAYLELIEEHMQAIHKKEEVIQSKKAELYALLATDERTTAPRIQNELGQLQSDVEQIHFEHFEAVESLCRDDQKVDFKEVSSDLQKFFRHTRPGPKHR